jgi:murein DD-endopeptidase MepM/ murein hydrolase activator NlpD
MLRMGPRRRRLTATLTAAGTATVLSASLLVGSSAVANPDPAGEKARVDAGIDRLEDSLSDTSAALTTAYRKLKQTRARLETAKQTLVAAREAEAAADRHHQEMVARLEVAQANEARAVERLERTRDRLDDTRRRVASFAAQMYQEQGLGELSVAMDAESPTDLASRLAMADTVMTVQNDSIDELVTMKAGLIAQESHLRALREEVAAAEQTAKKALDRATAARERAVQAKADLTTLKGEQTRHAVQLKAERAKDKDRLRQMRAESRRLQKQLERIARQARIRAAKIAAAKAAAAAERQRELAAAQRAARSSSPAPPPAPAPAPAPPAPSTQSSGGYLSYPVSAPISSEFGYRMHPIYHVWRLHAGMDFAAGCGTPIHAAASGTIVSAGYAGGAGNMTVINHGVHRGVSLATVYMHQSSFAVRGGHVNRGQVIGYVGTTGSSTGCHLHFETRENGTPVNPRSWL